MPRARAAAAHHRVAERGRGQDQGEDSAPPAQGSRGEGTLVYMSTGDSIVTAGVDWRHPGDPPGAARGHGGLPLHRQQRRAPHRQQEDIPTRPV